MEEMLNSIQEEQQSAEVETLDVYVSIMPRKYFVEHIGGDVAEVHVMVPPGQSPATCEPTPKQVSVLGGADVFFTLGDKPSPKQLQRVISFAKGLWNHFLFKN